MISRYLVVSVEACVECACHTCLLTSAPAWSSHRRHSGWPPNAAMWVGVCANRDVTAFTPQPTWTRRITHSSCGSKDSRSDRTTWRVLATTASLNSESKRTKTFTTTCVFVVLRYSHHLGNVNTSRLPRIYVQVEWKNKHVSSTKNAGFECVAMHLPSLTKQQIASARKAPLERWGLRQKRAALASQR